MSKKKRTPVEEEVEINMTPMIDVTFQLLVFFIVTLRFKTLEKKIETYLPTDLGTQSTSLPEEKIFVTVSLRQPLKSVVGPRWRSPDKTRYLFEREEIPGSTEAMRSEIAKRLRAFRRLQPEAIGKIDASMGVPHGHVVAVLDTFKAEGYETVMFSGLVKSTTLVKNDLWFQKMKTELQPR